MLENKRLTAPGHFQDTRHIELDLGDSDLAYEPGWLLAVCPRQPPASVAAFLRRCGLDPEEWVRVEAAEQPAGCHRASAEVRSCLVQSWCLVSSTLPGFCNAASPCRVAMLILNMCHVS